VCHQTTDTKIILLLIVPKLPEPQTLLLCLDRKGTGEMKELRIVIADDSLVIREELQKVLLSIAGLTIVGVATDGDVALSLAQTTNPDVLILDMSMPRLNGLQVLQEIRKKDNSMTIIMFSADPALILQDACLKAGANFYLSKSQFNELATICQDLRGN
jgi:DNA-binding NarL/FixJ family response regulator